MKKTLQTADPTLAQPRELAPRVQQTLELLLRGQSEKEVAWSLGLSRHTVHVYVKQIYKTKGVRSRAELIVRCLRQQTTSEEPHVGE